MEPSKPLLDSHDFARELRLTRARITRLTAEPAGGRDVAERLSAIGLAVTAACEQAFLRLTDASAA